MLVILNVVKLFADAKIVVHWTMVQIVVIQAKKVIGLVACPKFRMDYVGLIIWVFGMQSVNQFVLRVYVSATIVVQVVLMRVRKLTGIVVIKKSTIPSVQRLQNKSE